MNNFPIHSFQHSMSPPVASTPHPMRALKLHGVLPPLMQRTAWELHTRTGVSLEGIIPLMLGIAAFACQGVANVSLRPDRPTPLSLFVTLVSEPANGKSEMLGLLLRVIYQFEAERRAKLTAAGDAETDSQILFSNMSKEALPQTSGLIVEEEGDDFKRSPVGKAFPSLSKFFDGRLSRVNRVSRGSQVGDHVRVGIVLTLPPGPWQQYIQQYGSRLLTSGLGSRELVAEVFGMQESQYTEERMRMGPAKVLPEWEDRLLALLRQSVWTSEEVGTLPLLHLTEEAKRCWMQVGRHWEGTVQHAMPQLMKPHAKRFPQMVGRVAAVLHLIEGYDGLISAETIERARVICEYFLEEAVRMLMPAPTIPQAILDAQTVENLLRCQPGGSMSKEVLVEYVQLFDVSRARAKKAVLTLLHSGRAQLVPEGRIARVCLVGYPVFSV